MTGERQPLTIPLQGLWSPSPAKQRRQTDPLKANAETDPPERVWAEIVHWFEQQREWAELASCLDGAAG